ncbi:8-amino-7-oxononanoate synthase 2 [bacterium YEK0313]|nr:8-amino-7-oxononanoate synthase 2 [bacterium YEK0313]
MSRADGRSLIGRRGGGRAVVDGADMVMLGSNDYLGLSTDPRVIAASRAALDVYGTGVGLYPVFAATPLHEELAASLAAFLGTEAVVLYGSGGAANAGVLTTLVEAGDVILSDRLNHASIIDGCRLSRADVLAYGNRDVADLTAALARAAGARRRLIITDGIFSMEGGAAPLDAMLALACAHDAMLVVDEAHASGVVGPDGTGTAPLCGIGNDAPGLVLTGSLSKALGGASGGFVAGPRDVIERLERTSRGWIFSMGMTTANVAAARAAIDIVRSDQAPLARLRANVEILRTALAAQGLGVHPSDSAILALAIGDEDRTRSLAAALRARGVYAPAVAYPIVARGEARLRLQVSAAHEPADLERAAGILADLMA